MNTSEKQAYLIEAHQYNELLQTLLRMLDVPWNDIFIHMDSKNQAYRPEVTEQSLQEAGVFHAQRVHVVWGGVSQIRAEFSLLREAVRHGPYQHYHLISGADLPIQTPGDIRSFFEANSDSEFVSFDAKPFSPFNDDRVYYRHFFQNRDIRGSAVLSTVDQLLLAGQRMLGLKRNQGISFRKGGNWFSCTDRFARYLLEQEEWVLKVFDKTFCPDEFFVQTLMEQSPFREKCYQGPGGGCMRAIDWERGCPYVWQESDLAELKASPCMFARKFDFQKHPGLVRSIEQLYGPKMP